MIIASLVYMRHVGLTLMKRFSNTFPVGLLWRVTLHALTPTVPLVGATRSVVLLHPLALKNVLLT